MLNWIVFGLCVLNTIIAFVPNPDWATISGWFCASLGWLLIAVNPI